MVVDKSDLQERISVDNHRTHKISKDGVMYSIFTQNSRVWSSWNSGKKWCKGRLKMKSGSGHVIYDVDEGGKHIWQIFKREACTIKRD